jgi:hypothetical protein
MNSGNKSCVRAGSPVKSNKAEANMKCYLVAGLALLGLAGLSLSEEKTRPDSKPQTNAAPAVSVTTAGKAGKPEPYNVIGFLEGRDRVMTLKSSARGPVYTVATKEGKVLHENLSAEQLKAQAPEVYRLVKTAVAGDSRGTGPRLDASVWSLGAAATALRSDRLAPCSGSHWGP